MAKYKVTIYHLNEQVVEANTKKEALEKRSFMMQVIYRLIDGTKIQKLKEK